MGSWDKMGDAGKRWLSRLRQERGVINLLEPLVAIPIMLAMMTASFGLELTALNQHDRAESRARAGIDQQIALKRITRDLRQATRITGFSDLGGTPGVPFSGAPYNVSFEARIKPSGSGPVEEREIAYQCVWYCFRNERPVGSTWAGWERMPIRAAVSGTTGVFGKFELDPEKVDDPTCQVQPCAQVLNETPRRARVTLTVDIKHERGQHNPNPTNPIALSSGAEFRNMRPMPEEAVEFCDLAENEGLPECNG